MFKRIIFILIFLSGLGFFAGSAEASHICPLDRFGSPEENYFIYNFTIEEPYERETFNCSAIDVHVDLDINHCFNAPTASYRAFYENDFVAEGDFPDGEFGLDSDVYFRIPEALVKDKGNGQKNIRVEINTSDSCGEQDFVRNRKVIVNSCIVPPSQGAYAPLNTPPVGNHDAASCSIIGGWAYDPDTPDSEIAVHIYKDGPAGSGTFVAATQTTGLRPDVNASLGISGNHGFTLFTPNSLKDGQSHQIYVHAIDSSGGGPNNLISNTPKTISCDLPNTPRKPDLLISTGPDPDMSMILVGSEVNFDATVHNPSQEDTSSPFDVLFTVDGLNLSTENVSGLSSIGSVDAMSSSWFAQGLGTHQVQVCADSGNSVDETDETNNCSTSFFEVLPETGQGYYQGYYEGYYYSQSYYQGAYGGGGGGGTGAGGGCFDGLDNDDDGWIDEEDLACGGFHNEICTDFIDNDGDGFIDDNDPDCTVDTSDDENGSGTTGSSNQCSDFIDNDGDGFVDGHDPDCSSPTDPTEKALSFEEF